MTSRKLLVIVLDGVGCGALPDAADYGDAGSDTLGNLSRVLKGLDLPNLGKLGLGNIHQIQGVPPVSHPAADYGKMAELSPAKDSTAGHWELMGCPVDKPFPTYPDGFPPEIVERLRRETGCEFIGNKAASGTAIIAELGEEHLRSGALILYTSADSVLQIAAHEGVVPVDRLYAVCRTAREVMQGKDAVGRIIARPFAGEPGAFRRTERRHDFSLQPPGDTVLDILKREGIPTVGVGKIIDLFGGRGLSKSHPVTSNLDNISATIELSRKLDYGLLFTNLVDFDMLWGHRNDPEGFYRGLREFDLHLPEIMATLRPGDILMITADHGVDPTTISTDHSREYVPILHWGPGRSGGRDLGVRASFADVGATAAEFFGVKGTGVGGYFVKVTIIQPL